MSEEGSEWKRTEWKSREEKKRVEYTRKGKKKDVGKMERNKKNKQANKQTRGNEEWKESKRVLQRNVLVPKY